MSAGEKVYDVFMDVDPSVGSGKNERVSKIPPPPEVIEQGKRLWDGIAQALGLGNLDFRRTYVYDGVEKASDPAQVHRDHFYPETEFHPSTWTEDFQHIRQYKYGIKMDVNVPVHTRVDENGAGTPPADELTEIRDGYRLILRDPKVTETSIIFPILRAMPINGETDIPQDYEHQNPGDYKLMVIRGNVFELFVENKGCFFLDYIVYNGEINKDSIPQMI